MFVLASTHIVSKFSFRSAVHRNKEKNCIAWSRDRIAGQNSHQKLVPIPLALRHVFQGFRAGRIFHYFIRSTTSQLALNTFGIYGIWYFEVEILSILSRTPIPIGGNKFNWIQLAHRSSITARAAALWAVIIFIHILLRPLSTYGARPWQKLREAVLAGHVMGVYSETTTCF